jgi:hypothetical protein
MTQSDRRIPIDASGLAEALKTALPFIENPEKRADFERYITSSQVFLERALHDLLAALVLQINEARGPGLRLEYAAGGLEVVLEPHAPEPEPEPSFGPDIEGDFEKVTIRLPSELKDLISQAANLRGLSQNSWYLRELARALARQAPAPPEPPAPPGRRGRRLRGYVGD